MKLGIRFFATLKERVGTSWLEIEVPESTTVECLLAALVQTRPALEPVLGTSIVAVNQEFAQPDQVLTPNDNIVFFPPVSGG
ncbi:MAG: Molybdopterin synthase sulfur carrier subunit [Chloroflexi bacterium]|nr:Molybdopterin synthase sulfur carrier subunit [Chloroflexota bacterium]